MLRPLADVRARRRNRTRIRHHDHVLVTHVYANTYDSALGLGERDKDGSFRCAKAEHASLNRRLQEENIELAARLKKYVKQGPRLSFEIAGQGRGISVSPQEHVG